MPYTYDGESLVWQEPLPANTTDQFIMESGGFDDSYWSRPVANPNYVSPTPTDPLVGALSQYNQSNFDVSGAASRIRELGKQYKLTDEELAAAVPIFGNEHRAALNSGYTEGSNYNAIAQRAVSDALKTRGVDTNQFTQATQGYVSQGANEAQQRWQATQEDDGSGFGSLLSIAAIVASFVAPEFAPFLKAGAAAVGFAETGSPVGAILSYALPSIGGDFASGNIDINGQALGDGASSSFGNIDVNGQMLGDGASWSGDQAGGIVNQAMGAPIMTANLSQTTMSDGVPADVTAPAIPSAENWDPGTDKLDMTNANPDSYVPEVPSTPAAPIPVDEVPTAAPPAVTSAPPQITSDGFTPVTPDTTAISGSQSTALSPDEFAFNAGVGQPGLAPTAGGDLSKWFDSLKPAAQAAVVAAAGGIVSGAMSGVGNYAATQAKIAADQALVDKQAQAKISVEQATRDANKSGTLSLQPKKGAVLNRLSTGKAYYAPKGLIASRIG